ncbi:MAG: cytochrome C [Spirochaetales bacterium]|nr:cytochrome C [Spirochaetales bacterium]|tara:strand:+ start:768 stop:1175 length:408 start_codon:yes stop_codon:yes gene_type:complete
MVLRFFFFSLVLFFLSWLSPFAEQNKGIGPVKNVDIPETIDKKMAKEGEELFTIKCSSCHKFDEKFAGPPLQGVTKRRSAEWILNQIVNPAEMATKDPIAKKLVGEYYLIMPNQNIGVKEARKIYEYFRLVDSTK